MTDGSPRRGPTWARRTARSPWRSDTVRKKERRTFTQILEDQKNINILEVTAEKVLTNSTGDVVLDSKTCTLTQEDFANFLFDVVKINPSDCISMNVSNKRFDTKEIRLTDCVSMDGFIGSYEYLDHNIQIKRQGRNYTLVTFKNVPMCLPDEEILHLIDHYGEALDDNVVHETLKKGRLNGIRTNTRKVEVKFKDGFVMNNYYWMEGPRTGDKGARVTVLHRGQSQQCFNCLNTGVQCEGGGSGKACKEMGVKRVLMRDYMKEVRKEVGYCSLKQHHNEAFPKLFGDKDTALEEEDEVEETDESEDYGTKEETKKRNEMKDSVVMNEQMKEKVPRNEMKDPAVVREQIQEKVPRENGTIGDGKELDEQSDEWEVANSVFKEDKEDNIIENIANVIEDVVVFEDTKDPEAVKTISVERMIEMMPSLKEEEAGKLEDIKIKALERVKERVRRRSLSWISSFESRRQGRRGSVKRINSKEAESVNTESKKLIDWFDNGNN